MIKMKICILGVMILAVISPLGCKASSSAHNQFDSPTGMERAYISDDAEICAAILEEAVLSHPAVESVVVNLSGKRVLLNVCLVNEPSSEEVVRIKKELKAIAQNADPTLDQIAVSTGAEMYKRTADLFPQAIGF